MHNSTYAMDSILKYSTEFYKMRYMMEGHTALFIGPTGCGKSARVVRLLENDYKSHFDFIVIICPTLRWNSTYRERGWFWKDPSVILINPEKKLLEWIEKMSAFLSSHKTLFLLDDVIADSSLDRKRNSLIDLAISGRHKNHSLWFLTQSYSAIPRNVRRQAKMLYVWFPKDRNDLIAIHEENDVIETKEELKVIKELLKNGKHTCLVLRIEHPRCHEVIQ